MNNIRRKELEWYKEHGKYKDRIHARHKDSEYVIGDFSWNKKNPERPEYIEVYMKSGLRPLKGE
jgi:hypothetical protein